MKKNNNIYDGYISGGIIKSFTIYKKRRFLNRELDEELALTIEEKNEIKEELAKTFNLDNYIIKEEKNEILGLLKEEVYEQNIGKLNKEIMPYLGLFSWRMREYPLISHEKFNAFGIINRNLFDKYIMHINGYFFLIDDNQYVGEDSFFTCILLTTFAKTLFKDNKLSSSIYFDEINI